MHTIYQITCKGLCFGLIVDHNNKVVMAANVGRWTVGKPWAYVKQYWEKRGAKIEATLKNETHTHNADPKQGYGQTLKEV